MSAAVERVLRIAGERAEREAERDRVRRASRRAIERARRSGRVSPGLLDTLAIGAEARERRADERIARETERIERGRRAYYARTLGTYAEAVAEPGEARYASVGYGTVNPGAAAR